MEWVDHSYPQTLKDVHWKQACLVCRREDRRHYNQPDEENDKEEDEKEDDDDPKTNHKRVVNPRPCLTKRVVD